MVRIGLISDTHIREATERLPHQIAEAFAGVDLILHAGDIFIPHVLDELEAIAPVLAASGDDDSGAILSDKRVKECHVLQVEGQTLWLVHESPEYYALKSRQASAIKGSECPDIIVFGHTHYSIMERHKGMFFVNPGSPMDHHDGLGTVAILDIISGKACVNTLRLKPD